MNPVAESVATTAPGAGAPARSALAGLSSVSTDVARALCAGFVDRADDVPNDAASAARGPCAPAGDCGGWLLALGIEAAAGATAAGTKAPDDLDRKAVRAWYVPRYGTASASACCTHHLGLFNAPEAAGAATCPSSFAQLMQRSAECKEQCQRAPTTDALHLLQRQRLFSPSSSFRKCEGSSGQRGALERAGSPTCSAPLRRDGNDSCKSAPAAESADALVETSLHLGLDFGGEMCAPPPPPPRAPRWLPRAAGTGAGLLPALLSEPVKLPCDQGLSGGVAAQPRRPPLPPESPLLPRRATSSPLPASSLPPSRVPPVPLTTEAAVSQEEVDGERGLRGGRGGELPGGCLRGRRRSSAPNSPSAPGMRSSRSEARRPQSGLPSSMSSFGS